MVTIVPGADAAVGAALDDLGRLEQVLELADAALHVALLVLGGVVVAVLAEVAHQAGRLDLLRDLDPPTGREVVELGLQPVVGGAGELVRRHSGGAYRRFPSGPIRRWPTSGAP